MQSARRLGTHRDAWLVFVQREGDPHFRLGILAITHLQFSRHVGLSTCPPGRKLRPLTPRYRTSRRRHRRHEEMRILMPVDGSIQSNAAIDFVSGPVSYTHSDAADERS